MAIFIGRQEALSALINDLGGPSSRSIAAIHGLGGVGKTTLKAELLLRLQDAGARIPFCHADENTPRSDLAEFLVNLATSLHLPWEGPQAEFSRLVRHCNRLRDLKSRLVRQVDHEILGQGIQVALSGMARRALLTREPAADDSQRSPLAADGFSAASNVAPPTDGLESVGSLARNLPDSPFVLEKRVQTLAQGDLAAGFTFQQFDSRWTRKSQRDYEVAVSGWTHDHEERELLLDPLAVLTRDFLDDMADTLFPAGSGLAGLLAARHKAPAVPLRVLVVIDSYEALDSGVQEWLLVHLLPALDRQRFQGRPLGDWLDLRLLVCGRQALRDSDPLRRWDVLARQIREIDLDRFEPDEIQAYLQARGLPSALGARALAETQGLPYLLALWCDSAGSDRARAVERAARRIFWWKSPTEVRWIKAAAFLDAVDRDSLAIALADGSQESAYAWLASNSELTRSDAAGILTLHPILKDLVREALNRESASESAELARRSRIAAQMAALGRQVQPGILDSLALLAPLRWFDPTLLHALWPAQASDLFGLAERLLTPATDRPSLVIQGPDPDSLALPEDLRQDLISYLKLVQPARFHESTAQILELDQCRRTQAAEHRSLESGKAQSLERDAAVARKRAMALDSRFLAVQAQERVASEALQRAQKAADRLNGVPARSPWWAAAATAAFGAAMALAAQSLLVVSARPWALAAATTLAAVAFALTLRALALPKAPTAGDHGAARRDIDAASTRIADLQAELSQLMIEASESAREADALDAQASAAQTAATQAFVPLL